MGQKVYFLPLSKKGKEKLAEAEVHMVNAKLQWVEISCDEINSKDCLKDYMDKSIFIVSPLEGDAYDKYVRACHFFINELSDLSRTAPKYTESELSFQASSSNLPFQGKQKTLLRYALLFFPL